MKKKRCNEGSGCSAVKNRQPRDFRYDCEIFAMIAKISLGLRKFRCDCENFAAIAKISHSKRN